MIFIARHALGERLRGEALVACDGFSARYDLDRVSGIFSRPSHKLAGESYVGKTLVLDTANGGLTLLAGFDEDITAKVPNRARVELDPASRSLRLL